jgi:hypothetical protein
MRKMVAIDKQTWDKIVELSNQHHGLPLGKVVAMVIEFYLKHVPTAPVTYPTERQE